MKASRKGILWVALAAVIAVGGIVPRLQAEPSSVARFTLPFDAQWSGTSLAKGDYTISLDHTLGSYGAIVVHRGNEVVGMALPQTLDSQEGRSLSPALLCIHHDGKVTVRALRLPNVGTFYFSMPKNLQTLVAQQPQLIETVPVQLSGE